MSQKSKFVVQTTILATISSVVVVFLIMFLLSPPRSMTLFEYCASKGLGITSGPDGARCVTDEEIRRMKQG